MGNLAGVKKTATNEYRFKESNLTETAKCSLSGRYASLSSLHLLQIYSSTVGYFLAIWMRAKVLFIPTWAEGRCSFPD